MRRAVKDVQARPAEGTNSEMDGSTGDMNDGFGNATRANAEIRNQNDDSNPKKRTRRSVIVSDICRGQTLPGPLRRVFFQRSARSTERRLFQRGAASRSHTQEARREDATSECSTRVRRLMLYT